MSLPFQISQERNSDRANATHRCGRVEHHCGIVVAAQHRRPPSELDTGELEEPYADEQPRQKEQRPLIVHAGALRNTAATSLPKGQLTFGGDPAPV